MEDTVDITMVISQLTCYSPQVAFEHRWGALRGSHFKIHLLLIFQLCRQKKCLRLFSGVQYTFQELLFLYTVVKQVKKLRLYCDSNNSVPSHSGPQVWS